MPKLITSVKWEASGLPSNLSFNKNTGTFTGTAEQVGEYTVPVKVTTNYGEAQEDVNIFVDGKSYKVYAVGDKAELWSEGAEADENGFRKLNMPSASVLYSVINGFAARTVSGFYVCGIPFDEYFISISDFDSTKPVNCPIPNVREMAGWRGNAISTPDTPRIAYRLSDYTAYLNGGLNLAPAKPEGTDGIFDISASSYGRNAGDEIAGIGLDKKSIKTIHSIAGSTVFNLDKEIKKAVMVYTPAQSGNDNSYMVVYLTSDNELCKINLYDMSVIRIAEEAGNIRDFWQLYSTKILFTTANNDVYCGYTSSNSLTLDKFEYLGNYDIKRVCGSQYNILLLTEDGKLYQRYVNNYSTATINYYPFYTRRDELTRIYPEYDFKDIVFLISPKTLIAILGDK